MSKCSMGLLIVLFVLAAASVYAVPVGPYEISDFSANNRALTLGSNINKNMIDQAGGLNFVTLSGDNGYIKTSSGIGTFTNDSDWSWMTILRKSPSMNCRIFMRGFAWGDVDGDFDLRMHEDNMATWHRKQFRWYDLNSSDSAVNSNEFLWLATTYDLSEQKARLYVNGRMTEEFSMASMSDLGNSNPININGQWANNVRGVGNVYGEGTFDFAQLMLSRRRFSQQELEQAYLNQTYLAADENTALDIRVVPEPASMLLMVSGLLGIRKHKG